MGGRVHEVMEMTGKTMQKEQEGIMLMRIHNHSLVPWQPSSSSTSNPSAGSRSAPSSATAAAVPSATLASSSTSTDPKYAGAPTAVFLTYVSHQPILQHCTFILTWVLYRPRNPTARCSSLCLRLLILLSLLVMRQRSPRDTRATPESLWNSDRLLSLLVFAPNLPLAFFFPSCCSVYKPQP